MKKIILTCIFSISAIAFSFAQEEEKEKIEKPFEFVLSGVYDYVPKSGDFSPAIEAHLTYWTTEKFGFGFGYTGVFEGEGEVGNELIALLSYKPIELITINTGPSFGFVKDEDTDVSAYLEAEFNFELGDLEIGPLIGSNIGQEFSLFTGIHVGIAF